VKGPAALELLQTATCNDVSKLDDGRAQYNGLLYPTGGFVDDILIYRNTPDDYFVVVNASNSDKDYEWIADLARGKRPAGMKDDEAAVYDFCKELHEKKSVSDSTYRAVVERFGERGAVDLIAVSGYYTLVSMVLNVDRHPIPGGAPAPLAPLE